MKRLVMCLLLTCAALLAGCGGGEPIDDEAELVRTPDVDCKARPELCK
jgi:hypothetical protein